MNHHRIDDYASDLDSDNDSVVLDDDGEYIDSAQKCVICRIRYPHPGYPTCGLTCGRILQVRQTRTPTVDALSDNLSQLDVRYNVASRSNPRGGKADLCVVCNARPKHAQYPTCGLVCAGRLQAAQISRPIGTSKSHRSRGATPAPAISRDSLTTSPRPTPPPPPPPLENPCVVCKAKEAFEDRVTCSPPCVQVLATQGGDPGMCDYCHRSKRAKGLSQCGTSCATKAKVACLFCRSRQRNGRYHLCGNICRSLSMKHTPLLLEAPRGHSTFEMVETKFKKAWKSGSSVCPEVKRVFKIIENNEFLRPYNAYRTSKKNEHFRYHGTKRSCSIGKGTQKEVCKSASCSVCSILKTSFKVQLALPSGAFGAGIYTSSASNKAFSYSGTGGAMLLTKVVLGKVRNVGAWQEVMSCPPGFDSVVFDRQNGTLNETIVYTNDAIRPVFLITF